MTEDLPDSIFSQFCIGKWAKKIPVPRRFQWGWCSRSPSPRPSPPGRGRANHVAGQFLDPHGRHRLCVICRETQDNPAPIAWLKTRRTIPPLLGERAGVRADTSLISCRAGTAKPRRKTCSTPSSASFVLGNKKILWQ
jgi:hypothetical protein